MKLLTKEQEQEHYRQTLKGGTIGGTVGLAVGTVGVLLAQRRYHFFRNLTLPLKAFLVTSAGTFAGIVEADHYSRAYEIQSNPIDVEFHARQAERERADKAGKTFTERAMDFGRRERYKIVAGSWIASMGVAFALVNRNKYLTGPQKIVQARVYAQFLTLGVLVATAAFEISDSRNSQGRWETVRYIDPTDPDHKRMLERQVERDSPSQGSGNANDDLWKEMVAAEEQRMKEREARHKEYAASAHNHNHNNNNHQKKSSNSKKQKKDEESGNGGAEEENGPEEEK